MQQLSSNVFALRLPFTVTVGPNRLDRFVYAYVVLGEHTWLIDAGVAGSETRLLEVVAAAGRPVSDVRDVLLTHSHVDHLGSVKALSELTPARIHIAPAEQRWAEDVDAQARDRPVPGFHQLCGGSVKVTNTLHDGDVIEISPDLHLRVLATPGHSPGHTSFYLEEQRILFTGDAVPVRGDMPVYDDALASARSIARLRMVRNVSILASAWDEPRFAADADAALTFGAGAIEHIHSIVTHASTAPDVDPMGFCREVVEKLELPPVFANPMSLRTFLGHARLRGRENLVG